MSDIVRLRKQAEIVRLRKQAERAQRLESYTTDKQAQAALENLAAEFKQKAAEIERTQSITGEPKSSRGRESRVEDFIRPGRAARDVVRRPPAGTVTWR